MKGYRTLIFAVLLAAFGAVQATLPAVQKFMTPEMYGLTSVGIAVVVAVLRVVTSTPIFSKT